MQTNYGRRKEECQVSRLNEALLVVFSAMTGMNLKAVDRVVKIVGELDRYHGFFAAERRPARTVPRITVRRSMARGPNDGVRRGAHLPPGMFTATS
jgi:hypothetical protein